MRHKLTTLCLLAVIAGLSGFPIFEVHAEQPVGRSDAPRLDTNAQQGFQEFQTAPLHRAFAIAPGGAWAWGGDAATEEIAEADALNACRQYTEQPCHVYSIDDQIVLDESAWNASWDLHANATQVSAAPVGTGRGNLFPDLALTTPDGRAITLSDLRGKPVFLHFWGSWCPPCQAEFADLQMLYDSLVNDAAVAFVLVQGRESIIKSRRWAKKRGITMPLYDSGHMGRADTSFHLADGSKLADRRLASAYPTTFVLDANGLVVFHQEGAGKRWIQYEKMIRHLTTRSQ